MLCLAVKLYDRGVAPYQEKDGAALHVKLVINTYFRSGAKIGNGGASVTAK